MWTTNIVGATSGGGGTNAAGGGILHRQGLGETILVFAEHRVFLPGRTLGEIAGSLRRAQPEKSLGIEVATVEEAVEAAQSGFARRPWDLIGEAGETRLKAEAVTVRCLQRRDGSIPSDESEPDLVAIVAKSY